LNLDESRLDGGNFVILMFYKAFAVLVEASPPELMAAIGGETELFGRVGYGTFDLEGVIILRGLIQVDSALGGLEDFLGVRKGPLASRAAVFDSCLGML
jgi:hypothetical protein